MDDINSKKNYHPEDEYEILEIGGAADAASKEPPTAGTAPQSAPAQPAAGEQPVVPKAPEKPVQQVMYYHTYPQQPAAAQPIAQQPVTVQPMTQQPVQYVIPAAYPQETAMTQVYQVINPATGQLQQIPVTFAQPYQQAQATPGQPQYMPVQNTTPGQPQYVPLQNAIPAAGQSAPQQSPYPAKAPQKNTQPRQRLSAGTIIFLCVLVALLASMVFGFTAYIANTAKGADPSNNKPDNGIPYNSDSDPYSDYYFGNNSVNYTDVEDTIVLAEDNGDTQKRTDDNKESVGTPDESAKGIVLNPLPKDKDDEKYTTKSAYNTVSDSVVTVKCYKDEISDDQSNLTSMGSGTIISSDGYLITNAHVIGNSRAYLVNVILLNGDQYQAKIVGYDTWSDLAVLKIDATDLKAATFGDSDLINIGDDVITIGSPGGEKFQNSLTKGIVSAVDRELTINKYVRYIQSDAAISPGNSGGPLCNIYGQVIGITTSKAAADNYENMTFSIPSKTVETIVSDLIHYGYVKGRVRIGLTGTETSSYYGEPAGILIESIDENGSLAGTKIKEGDIVTELDGQSISSFQDIYAVLAKHKTGDKVTIKVKRPSD